MKHGDQKQTSLGAAVERSTNTVYHTCYLNSDKSEVNFYFYGLTPVCTKGMLMGHLAYI